MILVPSIIGGALLGTRYKVFCLVPIATTGITAIAAFNFLHQAPLSSTVLTGILLTVGMQVGYLIGVTVRWVLLPARGVAGPAPPLHAAAPDVVTSATAG
jgi:hypothetical protein